MKFSVIIPVYNVEKYLEGCICSVLNQSYQNFEIILVDDGSTDSSGEICDNYETQYPDKIRVFHTENQGVLLARLYGIKRAIGKIVVFVDSDDSLRADALGLIAKAFTSTDCQMVLYKFSVKPNYGESDELFPFQDGQFFEGESKKELYEYLVKSSTLNTLWLKAVKKEIADSMLDYENYAFVKHGEDLLCSLPLVTAAERIVYLDQNLYFYRQREGSAIHSFDPKRHESIKAVHQEMERYIDLWNMPELHVKHYEREVRGWIYNLRIMLENRKVMDKGSFDNWMHQLASDQYFRTAYQRMDTTALSARDASMAKLLYEGKYRRLCFADQAIRLGSKIKKSLKK